MRKKSVKFSDNLEILEPAPWKFHLSQNYPNPFSDKTVIKYCVAFKTRVKLTVFDPHGKVIQKLVDREQSPGTYEIEFSAGHSRESNDPDGVIYIYRLDAGDYRSEKKMSLQKYSERRL
jgi:hypothetical protein